MVAKKIMALLVSASPVVGACPPWRVANATEITVEEGEAIQLLDDADAMVTTQSEEDVALEDAVDLPDSTVLLQADAGLPSRFDLRDRGVVTPVKKQEPWGYCWAHGAIAAAETSILTAMGST